MNVKSKRELHNEVGHRIRKIREDAGLMLHEFAAKIGAVKTTVSMWESGQTAPRPYLLYRIAVEFNVSPDFIFFGDEP